MAFRASFLISYLVFVVNIGATLELPAANVVEKGLFLISSCIYLSTRKVDRTTIILFIVLIFLVFLLAFFTDYPGFEWSIFINSLNQVFIIFALLAAIPTEIDRNVILRCAALLPIGCALLGFAYQALGLRDAFGQEFSTGIYRFQGSLIPAYLSGLAMCGIFAALQITMTRKPGYLWIAAINLVILLMAGGRAALVVTVITCGASILLKRGVTSGKKLIFALAGLSTFLLMLALFWDQIWTRFASSGANGRDLMWRYLLELSAQYPWTGIGFGHQYFAVPREVSILVGSAAAHNDFVRLTLELGYIGVIVFYLLLTAAVLRVMMRKNMRADLTLLVAYAGFLLLSRTDNALASPPYFPLVFLAALSSIEFPRALRRRATRNDGRDHLNRFSGERSHRSRTGRYVGSPI